MKAALQVVRGRVRGKSILVGNPHQVIMIKRDLALLGPQLWMFSTTLWMLTYVSVNFIYNEAKVTTVHHLQPVRSELYWQDVLGLK